MSLCLVLAGCTSDAVRHMRARLCACLDVAVQIQSDQPPVPQLPSFRPLMTPANRYDTGKTITKSLSDDYYSSCCIISVHCLLWLQSK